VIFSVDFVPDGWQWMHLHPFASMEFSYLVVDDFPLLQASVLFNRELSVLIVHGKCE